VTPALGKRCSIQLSYGRALERRYQTPWAATKTIGSGAERAAWEVALTAGDRRLPRGRGRSGQKAKRPDRGVPRSGRFRVLRGMERVKRFELSTFTLAT
jgi:hypothetical protein